MISLIKTAAFSLVLVSLLLHPSFVMAGSPVIDPTVTGTTSANVATSSTTTANVVLKTLKDYGLDQIAYALAQKLGQKMATATINKTTGGADSEKNPNYVQDFGRFLSEIEEQERDYYTTKLLASNNPFAKDIAKGLISSTGGLSGFSLGNVLQNGASWESVKSDLSNAGVYGYDFYTQLSFPQNTPIGASMIAKEQLANQIKNKQESQKLKLTSSGFLPDAKCNANVSDYKNNVSALVGSGTEQTFDTPEQAQAYLDANVAQQNATIKNLTSDIAGCIDEMIKNPVATTQTLTNEAGKFGMDMTKNINGWGQIVAGLFVSLFNGFVEKGLSSLKADYGQVKATNVGGPEQLYETTPGGGSQPISNFAKTPVNIVDLRNELQPSIDASLQNIAAINTMRTELIKVPVRLAYLDICIPGPDTLGLGKRMEDYYSQQTGWLQKKSAMGDDGKRNTYQEVILSMLERDFSIAKSETLQDSIDDSKNIPGVGAMRTAINRFSTRRPLWTSSSDSLTKTSDALSGLRKITSDLKLSLSQLQNLEPVKLAGVPVNLLPFTHGEWDSLDTASKNLVYTWATNNNTAPAGAGDDTARRDYVIKTVWNLWENPENFLADGTWSNPNNGDIFLKQKNLIRASFSALGDSVPSDWEISKNEQWVTTITSENEQADQLIHDCNKMREIIWGNTSNETGWFTTNPGQGKEALLVYLIQNKETLFKSDDVKNGLTLPNILNTPQTYESTGCRPSPTSYEAIYSSGKPSGSGDHSNGYVCYGNFGHLYEVQGEEGCISGCNFDEWIDSASNIYQSQPFIGWPTELYWKARILQFTPNPDPYSTGWTITTIKEGTQLSDGGYQRKLFCRFSSVMGEYAKRSGAALDRDSKAFRCSSKWADVSVSEVIASFITNQFN